MRLLGFTAGGGPFPPPTNYIASNYSWVLAICQATEKKSIALTTILCITIV